MPSLILLNFSFDCPNKLEELYVEQVKCGGFNLYSSQHFSAFTTYFCNMYPKPLYKV